MYLFKFIIEHIKRIHPTKLNPITHNEDDPDNDNQLIQTTENIFSPSTSAISSNLSSEHLISLSHHQNGLVNLNFLVRQM